MIKSRLSKFYPLLVYLVGFGVVLEYILTTDYLGGSTICAEFALYMHYITGVEWHPMSGAFGLQNICLPVTWLPARMQIITGIEPVLFYKYYHALILPLLPVTTYFVFKLFIKKQYALIGALFVIGTVTFLQSPSMARTTIALIFYVLLLLVIFTPGMRYRVPLAVGLSALMVLSHYTTTYLALFIFLGSIAVLSVQWLISRTRPRQIVLLLVISFSLVAGAIVWYGQVNNSLMLKIDTRVQALADTGQPGDIYNLEIRDKIIQVAFGVQNPDGDTIFEFNWWLFGVSWLVVALITWGMIISVLKRRLPFEFLVISAMCFALIALTVLIPGASRGYGIERVFYQCTPLFGVLLVKGTGNPGRFSWAVLLPLVLAYGYLNMNYGIIHSITGG